MKRLPIVFAAYAVPPVDARSIEVIAWMSALARPRYRFQSKHGQTSPAVGAHAGEHDAVRVARMQWSPKGLRGRVVLAGGYSDTRREPASARSTRAPAAMGGGGDSLFCAPSPSSFNDRARIDLRRRPSAGCSLAGTEGFAPPATLRGSWFVHSCSKPYGPVLLRAERSGVEVASRSDPTLTAHSRTR